MTPFEAAIVVIATGIWISVVMFVLFLWWTEPHWRRIFQSYSEWHIGGPVNEPIRRDPPPGPVRFPHGDRKRDLEYHDD